MNCNSEALPSRILHTCRLLALSAGLFALGGCATPANHYDPLEPINRKIYAFNKVVDNAVAKPIAKGYVAVTPRPIRTGVSNFFGNLDDVYIGTSDLLEGNWKEAGGDAGRILINSTFGLFGLLDIASSAGITKHDADFGEVLGKWGVGSGPYIVAPLLGPKTLRESADWIGAYYLNPMHNRLHDIAWKNSLNVLQLIDQRAQLLAAERVVDAASFGDEYSFVRDSYLQRRYSRIWDGNPPKPLKLGDDDVGLDSDDGDDATAPAGPIPPAGNYSSTSPAK